MQQIKNFLIGFGVSFLGSVPIGYLNVIGFQLYQKSGFDSLFYYLLGIIFTEIFVINGTLIFANKLSKNARLNFYIEIFGIILMFILFFVFRYSSNENSSELVFFNQYLGYSPFLVGVILNCFNFMQLPFWTSTNLYLLNKKWILINGNLKYIYVLGALIGIFIGMLTLVLGLSFVANKFESISRIVFSVLIPYFFLLMGIYQSFKFYKKHL